MSVLEAVILAIIEGLTEFLPVSSTGHLIIGTALLGITPTAFTKMFTVVIQFGTILSVIVLYYKRFIPGERPIKEVIIFYLKLLVAVTPALFVGFLFGDLIDQLLERVEVVAITLLIGGIFFLYIDKIFTSDESKPEPVLTWLKAFIIGMFQTVAMIPGVSRSAATIIGGLTQGLSRKQAAEFSFFLAVPTMAAASLWKVLQFVRDGNSFGSDEVTILVIGNVVAFIVGMVAIKSFISFLTRYGFRFFGYYRIALGLILLILSFLQIELSIL